MKIPSIMEMLEAGVHFGHQVSRWHPKMKQYIFTQRNGVHIIDLDQTESKLASVLATVKQMTSEGKQILFVSTKPQAREIVKSTALDAGMPFLVDRWVGGLLTNFTEIRKLMKKYISLKEQQKNGELERYTKKEQLDIARELLKMDETLGGLTSLEKIPDALFIPALQREKTAVAEANRMHVPIIAIADTNSNPDKADYIIPGNDDGVHAIHMLVTLVADAAKEGKREFESKKTEVKK